MATSASIDQASPPKLPGPPAFDERFFFELVERRHKALGRLPSIRELYEALNRSGGFRRILRLRHQYEVANKLRSAVDLPKNNERVGTTRRLALVADRLDTVAARLPGESSQNALEVLRRVEVRIEALTSRVEELARTQKQDHQVRAPGTVEATACAALQRLASEVDKKLLPLAGLKSMAAQLAKAVEPPKGSTATVIALPAVAASADAETVEITRQTLESLTAVASRLEAAALLKPQIEAQVSEASLEGAIQKAVDRGVEMAQKSTAPPPEMPEVLREQLSGLDAAVGSVKELIRDRARVSDQRAAAFSRAVGHLAEFHVAQIEVFEAEIAVVLDAIASSRARSSTRPANATRQQASKRRQGKKRSAVHSGDRANRGRTAVRSKKSPKRRRAAR